MAREWHEGAGAFGKERLGAGSRNAKPGSRSREEPREGVSVAILLRMEEQYGYEELMKNVESVWAWGFLSGKSPRLGGCSAALPVAATSNCVVYRCRAHRRKVAVRSP